jgi:hypothetical protein
MHVGAAQLEAMRHDEETSRRLCVIRRGRRREPAGGGHESQPLSQASRRPVRPRDSHIEYRRLSSLSRRCQGAGFAPAPRPAGRVRRHANGTRASPCIHGHTPATRQVPLTMHPGTAGAHLQRRPLMRARATERRRAQPLGRSLVTRRRRLV